MRPAKPGALLGGGSGGVKWGVGEAPPPHKLELESGHVYMPVLR